MIFALYASAQKKTFYCLGENGDTLFNFETHRVWHFYKDVNDKMGYLNRDRNIFMEAKYANAEAFSEGKVWGY